MGRRAAAPGGSPARPRRWNQLRRAGGERPRGAVALRAGLAGAGEARAGAQCVLRALDAPARPQVLRRRPERENRAGARARPAQSGGAGTAGGAVSAAAAPPLRPAECRHHQPLAACPLLPVHAPGAGRLRDGMPDRAVPVGALGRGRRHLARAAMHFRRRAVPAPAGRRRQPGRPDLVEYGNLHARPVERRARHERRSAGRHSRRPEAAAAAQGAAAGRARPAGARQPAAGRRNRALDRRVPARRGERLERPARQRARLLRGRARLLCRDRRRRISARAPADAGPGLRAAADRPSLRLRRRRGFCSRSTA